MSSAVVVGSGPNGLAAAAVLARAGVAVTVLEADAVLGGGARTEEAILPGLLHDRCSAVHPMAVGSPVLRELGLDLEWALPEIDCVHPLEAAEAGVLHRSVTETAAGLGADGPLWRGLFGGPSARYERFAPDVLGPLLRLPSRPFDLARFGIPALLPATTLGRAFRTPEAAALWAGVAAHAFHPLERPLTSAIGLGILTAGHRHGWAVARGGSGAITAALAADVERHGGRVETGVRVTELPSADVVL
ncbi:phytoene desaturase family protein, partial [Pseudonocardia pini]|uniref:phytoene desaturase family protein n=1 Tax=Pseudonocardia pini TaxID=2758030 RepID=UPI0015F0A6D5